MAETNIVDVKYIFLDVVGFTRGRSVEAQADIVETLNEIVGSLLHEFDLPSDERILLPTGDGICIAILKRDLYDLHIRFALNILEKLYINNINTENENAASRCAWASTRTPIILLPISMGHAT